MIEEVQKPISFSQEHKETYEVQKAQRPALKKRIYAFYVDLLIVGIFSHLMMIGYESAISEMSFISSKGKWLLTSNLNQMKIPLTTFVFWSYFSLSLYFSNGFTFGKKIFNLQIKKENQKELDFSDCSRRSLGYLVCYASFFSLFAISLFRKDKKGIPDFLSKSSCIKYEELSLTLSRPSQQKSEQIAA